MTPLDVGVRTARAGVIQLLFDRYQGFLCVAFLNMKTRKMQEVFFNYPDEMPQLLDSIEQHVMGEESIYFCPQLFSERRRSKETVSHTPNVWADLDTCHPDLMHVDPSVIVESSPGRYQAYWLFDREVDPDDAENLAKRIAYGHASDGADRSGWDLTQLLRVPYTYNRKYGTGLSVPVVTTIKASRARYRLTDFAMYPAQDDYQRVDIPMPSTEGMDAEELLQARRGMLNPLIWRHFTDEPMGTWSEALWNLQMLLFEAGFQAEEVFVIVQAAKCNKYARDNRPLHLLWKEVCRAQNKFRANMAILKGEDKDRAPLLNEDERAQVESSKETFVERYITWAKSLGDAAPQYHQAGAFVVLSSILAGAVRLPTSFGTIIPNLWFMILADTTLTRKSTAMDIAMDLAQEVDPDILLATDGSLEGLMTSIATRPSRPSVFLRDEFSGLLEAMTKKDYMAGMAETFTKLYDGKTTKRVLRKETVEVREPVLILFAGGIKDKVCSILTFEQVSSGFMPRFLFITAESDATKIQPLGPPTVVTDTGRAAVVGEVQSMADHYHQTVMSTIPGLKAAIPSQRRFEAHLTPAAWRRYNELESQLVHDGLATDKPEIMTPVNDRLSKSILKAAVLLAASRQRGDAITVGTEDILRAIYYGEAWKTYADNIMANVGRGAYERQMEQVYKYVERKPGATRSAIMQAFHYDARTMSAVLENMDQRGWIQRTKMGRTEQIFPILDKIGATSA